MSILIHEVYMSMTRRDSYRYAKSKAPTLNLPQTNVHQKMPKIGAKMPKFSVKRLKYTFLHARTQKDPF